MEKRGWREGERRRDKRVKGEGEGRKTASPVPPPPKKNVGIQIFLVQLSLCVKQNFFEWSLEKKNVWIIFHWSLNCTRITIITIIHFAGCEHLMRTGERIDSIEITFYNVCIHWWKHNSYELTSLRMPVLGEGGGVGRAAYAPLSWAIYFKIMQFFHQRLLMICIPLCKKGGARWLSGRVSDSGARGPGFETYRRRVVSLSKTLNSPKVLVNYPGSDGSVPTWLKNCWLGR